MPQDTPPEEVTAAIEKVSSKAAEWAALAPAEKRALFIECLDNLKVHGDELVRAACASRGYNFDADDHGHLVSEAYLLSVSMNAAWIRGAIELMDSLDASGRPPAAVSSEERPDGTTRVTVFPNGLKDAMLGDTGRWLGVPLGRGGQFEVVVRGKPEQFSPSEAEASVTGVLGAGNTEICNDIVDPMCKLNSVVIYKSNPVMALGSAVKEKIFKPLIDRGYLAIVHGGAEQGRLLVESSNINRLVLTGSCKTYDRIVWGNRDKSDASVKPQVTKQVTAELGSVNPYIIVPGDAAWSQSEIEAKADALAAYKLFNSGHICAAPQVVVTCRSWPQRDTFLEAVRAKLAAAPTTNCFYPGVKKMYEEHLSSMGDSAKCGASSCFGDNGLIPIATFDCLGTNAHVSKLGFQEEAFSAVLYEVALDTAANIEDFLPKAVDFCHEKCWGSLTCAVIVDDATKSRGREALDKALDSMKFGAIGVNIAPSSANAFPLLSWGAYPGHDERDIQSGVGHMGNFGCYKNVEKVIMHARFSNLHEMKLVLGSRAAARKRGRRLAETFMHMSYWRILKFASADFFGI